MKGGGEGPLTDAQRDLAAGHYAMAWKLARRFQRRTGLDLDDCVSAAMHGLMRAARNFDPARGIKFTTYGWNGVQLALRNQLRRAARDAECRALARPTARAGPPRPDEMLVARETRAHRRRVADDVMREATERDARIVMGRSNGMTLEACGALVGRTKEAARLATIRVVGHTEGFAVAQGGPKRRAG